MNFSTQMTANNSTFGKLLEKNASNNDLKAMGYSSVQHLPLTPLFVALYCVAGIIFIPGLLGNGIIIYVVVKVKKMRTPTNYLVSSLAIADLMMMITMVGFLIYVLQSIVVIPENVNAFLFPSLDILVGSASIGNLAAVSVDRALAVLHPLRYLVIVTTKRVRNGIRLVWVYSAIMFVCGMLRINADKKFQDGFIFAAYACSFIVPLIIITCCYAAIIFSVVASLRMTNILEKSSSASLCNDPELKREESKRRRRARIREVKVAMNFMIILVPFLGGWGFFFGLQFYELFTNTIVQNDLQEWFLYVIPWLNSSINPVVYICLNRPLRKECGKLLFKRCLRQRSTRYKVKLHIKRENKRRKIEETGSRSSGINGESLLKYDMRSTEMLDSRIQESDML